MLNPSRLAVARKRRGLTLTNLAELTDLSTRSLLHSRTDTSARPKTPCCCWPTRLALRQAS